LSVTDDIVEEIMRLGKEDGITVFSREIIREDICEGYVDQIADEIEEKLKKKGITVGA